MLFPKLTRSFALAFALGVVACGADAGDALTDGRETPAAGEDGENGGGDATGTAPEAAFGYDTAPMLLPFDVRFAKVAKVANMEGTDPALDQLEARRLELGDGDYATNVKPDLSWTPNKIGVWVKSMKPVCAAKSMRDRFPALPEKLDDLVFAAYGRPATPEDGEGVKEALGTVLDSESQYQVVCLAILSSLEFVAR